MRLLDTTKATLTGCLCLLLSLLALPSFAATPAAKKDRSAIESRAFHYFVDKEPAWVKRNEVPTSPSAVEGNPAYRVLLEDDQRQHTDKGIASYTHRALQALQKSALDKVSQIEIEFNPEYQTLTLHDFVIHRDGAHLNKLDRSKVRLIQREKELEKQMYNGVVSASILLDDLRVGDVVEYAYSIRGSNPIFANKIDFAFPLSGWDVPLERLNIRLLTQSGHRFSAHPHNLALEPVVSEQSGIRESIWSRTQVPALIDENEYPHWFIPAAWLEISEYEDWAQVSAWAQAMYRVPNDLSPELLAQIEQWRTASTSPQQAVLLALNFVQQEIRYFGVEIGTSSHRPSHPNQVFKQRYGDCKDKSLLLSTILGKLGITAHPALVSARFERGIENFLPTPRAFDHVITLAEIDGKRWWLDSTNNFQAGDLEHRGHSNFGRALVIGDGSTALSAIQVPDNGIRRIDETYTVTEFDQPVKLTVTERTSGAAANQMRFLIANYGAERMAEYRLNQYVRLFQGLQRQGQPVMADDHEHNEYSVTDSYVIDGFFQRSSARWKAELYNLALREYLDYPKVIKRKSPLGLNEEVHVRYSATLDFNKRNNGSNDEATMLADDYIQLNSFIRHDGRQIKLQQSLDFLQDHVPAAQVGEYVDKETQIRRQLGFSFSFPDRAATIWSDNAARQALLRAANIGDLPAIERLLAEGTSANARGYADVTPLLVAVMDNRLDAVRLLLRKGANVNARTEDDWTPLLSATLYGAEDIVAELLKTGADIKFARNGQTALMLAAEKGHAGIVRQLLAQGAEVDRRNSQHYNFTALMYAALGGHASAVQALLDGRANLALKDEKEFSPILHAAEKGDWPTLEVLLKAGANPRETTPKRGVDIMTSLVRSNRIDDVEAAIRYGIELNTQVCNGFSPLMYTIKNGNRRLVSLLKEHGARYREIGKEGWTSLMSALEHLDTASAQQLIAAGADVRATDSHGVSALTLASAFGLTEVADAIIKKGADVNLVDRGWQETPLMYAVENGNKKLVELLVNNGADPNRKDIDGDSVLARTYPMEKAELYDVLLAAGAKREFTHPAHRNQGGR
ncbi:MAG: ankyrin repeat domain-containing protein [Nitrosomonadales bacterium]|nr:ankyrin repeat domain-containing protein [Nitrosomonadales bacterium]